jgi:hypothetical protein
MDAVQSGRVSASGWIRWLPGIATLRSYEAHWLPHDIAAGLVLTTALAPVWDRVRRRLWPSGRLWPLCNHRTPAGPRALRPQPHPSAWARPCVGGRHSGRNGSARHGDVNRAVALAGMMAIVSGAVCILAGVARPLRLLGKRPGSRRKRNGDYRQCSCDVAGKDRQVRIHREDGSIHKENRRGPKTREACANAASANASRSCAGALVINGPR